MNEHKYLILPAILEKDPKDILSDISIFDSIVPKLQLDVLDSLFVDKISWPFTQKKWDLALFDFPKLQSELQIHLMLEQNMDFVCKWLENTNMPAEFVIQVESRDTYKVLKMLKNKGYKAGISFMMQSNFQDFTDIIELSDFVQFMCINDIGTQGSSFNDAVLHKIADFKSQYPEKKVLADGGIKIDKIQPLKHVGVFEMAVGSAIFGSENPVATWEEMSNILTKT